MQCKSRTHLGGHVPPQETLPAELHLRLVRVRRSLTHVQPNALNCGVYDENNHQAKTLQKNQTSDKH